VISKNVLDAVLPDYFALAFRDLARAVREAR
jgi:hypothetical protein